MEVFMASYGRHRGVDLTRPIEFTHDVTWCDNHTTQGSFDSAEKVGLVDGDLWSCDDVVTDRYRERIARGEIINNPFRLRKVKRSLTNLSSYGWSKKTSCSGATIVKSLEGDVMQAILRPSHGFTLPRYPGTSLIAETQAWANVASPDVLGGENMRDLEQTWRLLRHPLEGFHNLLHKVRNTNKFGAQTKALGEFMSDYWLQYRYGAVPLMHDLQNGFRAAYIPQFSDRLTARGSASLPPFTDSWTEYPSSSGNFSNAVVEASYSHEGYYRAYVLYKHWFSTSDKFGLSFHNLPATLWEILPYSFVVDWFLNVGDFIAACTPKAGVDVLASGVTYHGHSIENVDASCDCTGSDTGYNFWGTSGYTYTEDNKLVKRTPLARRGLSFRLNDLTFSKSKNWLHFADGVALAGQFLMRRPKDKPPRVVHGRPWTRGYGPWKGGII
jgi:hypothetical protein